MKKLMTMVMALVLAIGMMIPMFASADQKTQDIMWVNCADGKTLNVREMPDKKAKVLYRVESGKQIEILDGTDAQGWLYVRVNGKSAGYVMAKFLVAAKPGKYEITERSDNFRAVAQYTVAAKALNKKTTNSVCLRTSPNKTSRSIRRLTAGDQLTVVSVGKTWSKVVDQNTGRTGYVANDYIAKV